MYNDIPFFSFASGDFQPAERRRGAELWPAEGDDGEGLLRVGAQPDAGESSELEKCGDWR